MLARQLQSGRHLVRPISLKINFCGATHIISKNTGLVHTLPQRSFALCVASKHLQHSNVQAQSMLQRCMYSAKDATGVVNAKIGSSIPIQRWFSSSSNDQLPDLEAKLDKGRQILEAFKERGMEIPARISDDNLEYLASLSKGKQGKYVGKLVLREHKHFQKSLNKAPPPEEEEVMFSKERLLRRFNRQDYSKADDWRLAAAMKFNPQITLDFIYDDLMNWREIRHVASQIGHLLNANKLARQPFHMHFVNYHYGGLVEREMKKIYQDQYENLLIDITDKGLLDVFPQQNIVYLTPDSNNILTSYDPNKVYVIGALVDLDHETGASLSQAKQLSVEHCRLPLDRYLQWNQGHKSLTLDAVVKILLEQADHGDMQHALQKHVPQRKHVGVRTDVQNVTNNKDVSFAFSRAKHARKWDIEDEGGDFSPRHSGRPRGRRFEHGEEDKDWHRSGPKQRKY